MIFVTGGTGLLGSHLLSELSEAGDDVLALKRKDSNLENVKKVFGYYHAEPEEHFNKIDWVEGDILDYHLLQDIMQEATRVYHAAALVSYLPGEKEKMMSVNVTGTANIVNAALTQKNIRLCHVSSIAALGTNGDQLIDETVKWIPGEQATGYSLSKFHGELEVWRGMREGLDAFIVNPSVIIGPGLWEVGLMPLFKAIHKGFKYYTLGEAGFVDVRDVVRGMINLMDTTITAEQFIVSAENKTYREFFALMAEALNKKPPSVYATPFKSKLACTMDALISKLTGRNRLITPDALSTAHKVHQG
jgi:dihydroflavonol-4-reductase